MAYDTTLLLDIYGSTGAESDMYNPRRRGRLPVCDAPITNGYTWVDANFRRIEGQCREAGLRQTFNEQTGALILGMPVQRLAGLSTQSQAVWVGAHSRRPAVR